MTSKGKIYLELCENTVQAKLTLSDQFKIDNLIKLMKKFKPKLNRDVFQTMHSRLRKIERGIEHQINIPIMS